MQVTDMHHPRRTWYSDATITAAAAAAMPAGFDETWESVTVHSVMPTMSMAIAAITLLLTVFL
jgi:hypothetical protein